MNLLDYNYESACIIHCCILNQFFIRSSYKTKDQGIPSIWASNVYPAFSLHHKGLSAPNTIFALCSVQQFQIKYKHYPLSSHPQKQRFTIYLCHSFIWNRTSNLPVKVPFAMVNNCGQIIVVHLRISVIL